MPIEAWLKIESSLFAIKEKDRWKRIAIHEKHEPFHLIHKIHMHMGKIYEYYNHKV